MRFRQLSWMGGVIFSLALTAPAIRAAEFEKYLPGDTEFVLHANIRQAIDSPLGKKYLLPQIQAHVKGQAEAQEILTALGLDPVKDLQNITVAAPGNVSEKKWTALVQGSFDQAKVQAAADAFAGKQADALKIHKQDGATIYELRDPKKSQSAFAAFVEKDLLLLAPDKEQVTASLAKTNGGNNSSLDKSLSALIGESSGKESLWFALVPNQVVNLVPQNNKQAMDIAKKIKSLKAGVTLTDDVQLSLRIKTTDDKAAREIRQTLDGIKALLILAVTSNEQLKDFGPTITDILNSIKFSLDKSTVGMDLNVTGKQIEEGLNK